jgi:hypothetical protein
MHSSTSKPLIYSFRWLSARHVVTFLGLSLMAALCWGLHFWINSGNLDLSKAHVDDEEAVWIFRGAIVFSVFAVAFIVPLVNQTRLTIDAGWLRVRHGPLPSFAGNVKLPVEKIGLVHPKQRHVPRQRGGYDVYDVIVQTTSGRDLIIAHGLDKWGDAADLVIAIEKALGRTARAGDQRNG